MDSIYSKILNAKKQKFKHINANFLEKELLGNDISQKTFLVHIYIILQC